MSVSGLLNNNPLNHVFSGAQSLAYTMAVVLFLSALIAFGYRSKYVGIGLAAGSALSVAIGINVYEPQAVHPWTVPVVTFAIGIGLLVYACYVAWSQDYTVIGKVLIVNAVLLLASVAGVMFACSTWFMTPISSEVQYTWASVENYMWLATFVLGVSLNVVALVAVAMHINFHRDDLPGIRPLRLRTAGRFTTTESNDTADTGIAQFAR